MYTSIHRTASYSFPPIQGGATALFLAVQSGINTDDIAAKDAYFETASYLVWRGADVRAITNAHPEMACRYFAQQLKFIEIFPFLPEKKEYEPDYCAKAYFKGHFPLTKRSVVVETLRLPPAVPTTALTLEVKISKSSSAPTITVRSTTDRTTKGVEASSASVDADVQEEGKADFVISLGQGESFLARNLKQIVALHYRDEKDLTIYLSEDKVTKEVLNKCRLMFRDEEVQDDEVDEVLIENNTREGSYFIKISIYGNVEREKVSEMESKQNLAKRIKDILGTGDDTAIYLYIEIHDDMARYNIAKYLASKERQTIQKLNRDELSAIWVDHCDKGHVATSFSDPKVLFFLFPIPIGRKFLEACCISAMGENDWGAFNNLVVSAAVDHYWDKSLAVFTWTMICEAIYRALVSMAVYNVHDWIDSDNIALRRFGLAIVVLLLYWTVISALAFLSLMVHLFKNGRWKYLWYSLMFYVIDVFAISTMMVATVGILIVGWSNPKKFSSASILSVAAVFVWLKTLYYMRPFPWTGHLIKCIDNVMRSTIWFMVVLFVIIIGFSQALYLLSYDDPKVRFHTWDGALLRAYTYMINYANWDDQINEMNNPTLATLLVVAFTWIVAIVLLNLLIAIMNNAFDDIKTSTKSSSSMERAIVVLDQVWANSIFEKSAEALHGTFERWMGTRWERSNLKKFLEWCMRRYAIQEPDKLGVVDHSEDEVAYCIRRKLDCLDERKMEDEEDFPNRTYKLVFEYLNQRDGGAAETKKNG